MRTLLLAVLIGLSFAAITIGAALIAPAAGWIVGGVLGGVWSVLVVTDVPDRK